MAIADRIASQYTEADWSDSQHTGPGTLAGRYLRLFWHPICRSSDLAPGQTKPIRIMSEDFTLYRGESGQIHALAFRCAHRGTQLSTGWVEGDNLRCFYHGWMYDGSGQCVEQPAEPEPFCQRIRIRSYPTEEYLGLVFVYFGEGDPPPLPRYPDFEREQGREVNIYVRHCNYFNHLDNDTVHTWFVHRRPGHDYREWDRGIPIGTAEEDEFGIIERTTYPNGRVGVGHRGMPNIQLRKQPPDEPASPRDENTVAWNVPIDDESHLMIQVDITLNPNEKPRPVGKEGWVDPDEISKHVLAGEFSIHELAPSRAIVALGEGRVTDLVKLQDSVTQIGQGRIADREAEHLGRTDRRVILLRTLWERELRALAEGRPLKQWQYTERHVRSQ
jgi:5,5'-dehydrodivanillate O-demethylase